MKKISLLVKRVLSGAIAGVAAISIARPIIKKEKESRYGASESLLETGYINYEKVVDLMPIPLHLKDAGVYSIFHEDHACGAFLLYGKDDKVKDKVVVDVVYDLKDAYSTFEVKLDKNGERAVLYKNTLRFSYDPLLKPEEIAKRVVEKTLEIFEVGYTEK